MDAPKSRNRRPSSPIIHRCARCFLILNLCGISGNNSHISRVAPAARLKCAAMPTALQPSSTSPGLEEILVERDAELIANPRDHEIDEVGDRLRLVIKAGHRGQHHSARV